MSNKEINQVEIFEKLVRREMKQKEAAKILRLSVRQIKRKLRRYKENGAQSLVHKSRGMVSNRKIDQQIITHAIDIIREKYRDFGPTLAHEKLVEEHGLRYSLSFIRQEMVKEGLWEPRKKRKTHVHQLRERRACFGELVQVDGSPHDWFEGRGAQCNLNVVIDDATNNGLFQFSKAETTQDYLRIVEGYVLKYGLPLAFYVDKHSIFRINTPINLDVKKPSKTDAFEGLTQFGRAMKELGVELIFANTPQAKGRVERMNQTLQDRLVKEMRLKQIATIEEANAFLPEFTQQLNNKFHVEPRSKVNMHRPIPKNIDLKKILCIKEKRVLSKNLTFQFNNFIFQIQTKRSAYSLRKTTVTICHRYDGSITLWDHKERPLEYTAVKKLPNTRETSSKKLNRLVDDILIKRNPWESEQSDFEQPNVFYKSLRAV